MTLCYQLLIVVVIAIEMTTAQTTDDTAIECETAECVVDCSVSECTSKRIRAVDATLFTLNCGANECQGASVYGSSSNTSIITVNCYGLGSCTDISVAGYLSGSVIVNCQSQSSCNGISVTSASATNLTFNASEEASENANIWISTDDTENAIIECNGDSSCKGMYVNAGYQSISLYAIGDEAFVDGTFNAENAVYVNITCAAGYNNKDYACKGNKYYLPDSGENIYIHCYGYGCKEFGDIYVPNAIRGARDISLYFNGCGACQTLDDCVYCCSSKAWIIHCPIYDNSGYVRYDEFYDGQCQERGGTATSKDFDCSCDRMDLSFKNDITDPFCFKEEESGSGTTNKASHSADNIHIFLYVLHAFVFFVV